MQAYNRAIQDNINNRREIIQDSFAKYGFDGLQELFDSMLASGVSTDTYEQVANTLETAFERGIKLTDLSTLLQQVPTDKLKNVSEVLSNNLVTLGEDGSVYCLRIVFHY